MATPAALSAGRVGRAHGLDGSFYVTRARPRLLAAGTEVSVGGSPRAIVRRAGTEARPIVRLEGIDDRDAAERLRGAELLVAGAEAPALAQDEWWAHELEGCEVLAAGRRLGTVSRLIELPSCEVLEVAVADAREPLLVPMVKDAIKAIDPRAKRIEVDLEFLGVEPERGGAAGGRAGSGS